jgi:hypothetical protein
MDSSTRGATSNGGFVRSKFAAVVGGLRVVLDKALKRDADKWRPKARQS